MVTILCDISVVVILWSFGKCFFINTASILCQRNLTCNFLPYSSVFIWYTIAIITFLVLAILISDNLLFSLDDHFDSPTWFLDKQFKWDTGLEVLIYAVIEHSVGTDVVTRFLVEIDAAA